MLASEDIDPLNNSDINDQQETFSEIISNDKPDKNGDIKVSVLFYII